MQIDAADCLMHLESESFGVLGTADPDHGTHLVPAVFAVRGSQLAIPIDTVKPKRTNRLRRIDNLQADPRASLLIDHREPDWAALWWVRVDLWYSGSFEPSADWRSALAGKYPQYVPAGTIDAILVFAIRSMRGWSAV
jgi:PPOX class probable F420-dependent enzyme